MSLVPLYLGDALSPDSFELAIMVLQVIKAIIGIGIAIIAYRGYRKNESRPMLFLATGFILVLGVPFVLYIGAVPLVAVFDISPGPQAVVIGLAELSQVVGLLSILHALRL